MRYHQHTALNQHGYKKTRRAFSIPFWLLILAAFLLMTMVVLITHL